MRWRLIFKVLATIFSASIVDYSDLYRLDFLWNFYGICKEGKKKGRNTLRKEVDINMGLAHCYLTEKIQRVSFTI
jgi:hypothetical protein